MRILFIVPNVPSLIRPRPLHFIRRLSEAHDVAVVCLAGNSSDDGFVSQLHQHCPKFEVIRLTRWQSLWNCLVALSRFRPLRCAYFHSPRLQGSVQARIDNREVDLVHAEHLKSLSMVEVAVGQIPVVFDAVDCVSLLEARRRSITRNPLRKLFSWMESKNIARAEERAARLSNRVVISSPIDRQCYPVSARLREKLCVVSNGVDLEYFGFQQFAADKNRLVFCAKLDYFPNQDAALHLAGSLWPRLRTRRPDLRLEIVGSRPPRRVRALDGKENVRVIASVADVRPYLGRAWVALCPLRIRAGIQNKILEAMALGVPIVATRICCEGLAVEPGRHLLVADTPEEFVSAVELLLDNPPLRRRLIEAGRAYVEREHNWDRCVTALSDAYQQALADFAGSYPAVESRPG